MLDFNGELSNLTGFFTDSDITFTGGACALGNGTVTKGIGYFDTGTRQLLAMALNPAKSDGFIYVGRR